LIRALNTAWLAWLPDDGWTLANWQPNSCLARSIASVSISSTIFAAAIVTLARIALGILVGEERALCLQHSPRDDVLGRDQLDLVALAAMFLADPFGDGGIQLGKTGRKEPYRWGFRLAHRRDSTCFGADLTGDTGWSPRWQGRAGTDNCVRT
jgi:hypothetical protein